MKIYLKILCSFTIVTSAAYAALPEPPAEVKNILDAHADELKSLAERWAANAIPCWGFNVTQPDWLPGYYIKYGIERIKKAQHVQDVIDRNKLSLMSVAKKYAYHIPGRPTAISSNNYLVIAEKVNVRPVERVTTLPSEWSASEWRDLENFVSTPDKTPEFNIKRSVKLAQRERYFLRFGTSQLENHVQLEQVKTLVNATPYHDFNPGNYILDADGKITIIDTDALAVPGPLRRINVFLSWMLDETFDSVKKIYRCCNKDLLRNVRKEYENYLMGQKIKRLCLCSMMASLGSVIGSILAERRDRSVAPQF